MVTVPAKIAHEKNNTNAQFEFATADGKRQLKVVSVEKDEQLMFSGSAQNIGSDSQGTPASQ